MFVYANVQLEIHSPENKKKKSSTDVQALNSFYFTATLYDRKMCLLSFGQAYGSGEICKQPHSWNSSTKGFQLKGFLGSKQGVTFLL